MRNSIYDALEISASSSVAAVQAAVRTVVRRFWAVPRDASGDSEEAVRFAALAASILGNAVRRKDYDVALNPGVGSGPPGVCPSATRRHRSARAVPIPAYSAKAPRFRSFPLTRRHQGARQASTPWRNRCRTAKGMAVATDLGRLCNCLSVAWFGCSQLLGALGRSTCCIRQRSRVRWRACCLRWLWLGRAGSLPPPCQLVALAIIKNAATRRLDLHRLATTAARHGVDFRAAPDGTHAQCGGFVTATNPVAATGSPSG